MRAARPGGGARRLGVGARASAIAWAALVGTAAPMRAQGQASTALGDTITLEAALTAALGRDPRVASASSAADAAAAGTAEARAAWLPSVSGTATLTRFELPMVVAPLHGFDPRNPPQFDETLSQGRVTAAWTVFDGGARGARVAAASARADAAEAGADQAESDAILQLLQSYLAVLGARDALVAQRAREEELTAERARAARFVAEGASARVELLRADAELAATRAHGVGTAANRRAAEADLARRLGVSVERVTAAAVIQVRPDSVTLAANEPPDRDHPLLRQARARRTAADAVAREARATWLPRVQSTGALLGYGGGGTFAGEWQAGVQLDYPIFLGGARRARIDAAAADARRAAADVRAAEDAVDDATERARATLVEAAARAAALETSVASYQELARVEALALDEGAGVQSDYLRALAGLDAARSGLSDARRAEVLAAARLASAQGRLNRDWVTSHVEDVR